MKKDLRMLAREKGGASQRNPQKPQRNDENAAAESIREAAQKYEGKSEKELLGQLKEGFRQGKIDPKEIERFSKNAGAMLNDAQRKKLQEILQQLKD